MGFHIHPLVILFWLAMGGKPDLAQIVGEEGLRDPLKLSKDPWSTLGELLLYAHKGWGSSGL